MPIRVIVTCSAAARQVIELELQMETGSTVAQALQASGLFAQLPELRYAALGIWGRRVRESQVLRDQDRLEIYRPLKVDPKLARRQRFIKQGARAAGLFARRRPGAKAGY